MLYTNVNICDETHTFKYVIGYDSDNVRDVYEPLQYVKNTVGNVNLVYIFDKNTNIVNKGNYWVSENDYVGKHQLDIPHYKSSKLYIYFPQYSVETYFNKDVKYALEVNTWINGKRIVLGSYLISRSDAFAMPTKKLFGDSYVEYVTVDVINIRSFIYDPEWSDFKESVCEGLHIPYGSLLNVTLYPVEKNESGEYIVLSGFDGSQNSLQIDANRRDFLDARIGFCDSATDGRVVRYDLFDSGDDITWSDLADYVRGSYNNYSAGVNTDTLVVEYGFAVRNSNDVFFTNSFTFEGLDPDDLISPQYFNDIGISNIGGWSWWVEYEKTSSEPLLLQGIVTFSQKIADGKVKELFYIKTNILPLTQEVFSYFIVENTRKLDLNHINMNVQNINVVQKTEHIIRKYDNVNDAKSNIIQPVFFKVRELGNIVVHPEVTENICINLDQFKSKVNRFQIQIEGCVFQEIGRTGAGVIFKITGSVLPKSQTSGLYYILNENAELVTNGNYKYIM